MKNTLLLFTAFTLLLTGCKQENKAEEPAAVTVEKPIVYTSNYPLYYFANRIGGDANDLRFPARTLSDPSGWTPVADTIAAMQNADLILINGASFENWMMNVSLPEGKVVNTSESFKDQFLSSGSTFTHSHGDEGEHAHEGTAYTTWLDLALAAKQAEAVKNALVALKPEEKAVFEKNFEALQNDLMTLHREMQNSIPEGNTITVAFSHPVYQYLATAYGINGKSLHWEPETPIDHDMEHEIEHLIKDEGVTWLIWEGEPLPENFEKLSKMGVQSVVFTPMGGKPGDSDFLKGMEKNVEALKEIYREEL
ncbi:metal ABC transporter substrate-binding protein [Robertkochia sediminum]|uniref:metal ABC transporter substrate-binding protein n=1 Tax=Robertkochia sediminum TaxID=2785326 RepID=UPI001932B01D|nr:metal ABC transporter substrate-binding protein [Robertkochia sediminum]MBL7472711.1 zinc ABC transporter substrate-binding protein [Robertkochia sediminum]